MRKRTVNQPGSAARAADAVPERLICAAEGAQILSCSRATWWRRVADGTLPKPIKIGAMTRWKLSGVLAAIETFKTD